MAKKRRRKKHHKKSTGASKALIQHLKKTHSAEGKLIAKLSSACK